MKRNPSPFALVALAALASSCGSEAPKPEPPAQDGSTIWLSQGWSADEADEFWFVSQGSQILPYDWFLHLELAGTETPFRADAHMDALRFLPSEASPRNPDALPIGFMRGEGDSQDILGINCAACHTSRIEFGGKVIQVEGGPAMADFQSFVTELVASLRATLDDEERFGRFAQRVGGDAAGLRTQLEEWTARLEERAERNHPPFPPGYARVDALGNILNEVLAKDLGIPENQRPPDAPVSYPVMWDAHAQDFVQWNGSAPNSPPGPLLRNVGEVLGVFGTMKFTPGVGLPIYHESSVEVQNLKRLEELVAKLQSPQWPEALPAIDAAKAEAGAALYANQCESCHSLVKRDDPLRRIAVKMVATGTVGTDPVAAEGFLARKAKTGVLEGKQIFVNPLEKFGAEDAAGNILRNAVFGVMLGQHTTGLERQRLTSLAALRTAVNDKRTALRNLVGTPEQLTRAMYKARPLNGAWASAPYLHNGSVPSLWELLQKPEDRAPRFYVGSRAFDPEKVGFQSVASEDGIDHYELDTTLRGNSNAGHPYGTQLSDDEKRQLIEYVKTL